MSHGTVYIFSAPSGGGKSSLAKALMLVQPRLAVAVSHTTRAPRPGEEDGVHYHFIDVPRFESMVQQGLFLEYAEVFGNFYGTSRAAVDSLVNQGKDVLLDIDWQGMRGIKAKMPQAQSIFILPPSLQELERRLRDRGQDSEEVIAARMREAIAEMRHYDEFDYIVVNDEFDSALADLQAIVEGKAEQRRPLELDIPALLGEQKPGKTTA